MTEEDKSVFAEAGPGMLDGLRVVEIADEMGEYCGLLLAGLGAEVIKVEPPRGSPSRAIGPFVDDAPDPERSLHFWTYNRGKRSVMLDPENEADCARLFDLVASADVFLDATEETRRRPDALRAAALLARDPSLIVARMTPFGDVGPWKDFKASDLVHLALGGVMMNCGYDRDPHDHYDQPPIAPQLWHAYHIAGEQLALGIVAALLHRLRTGEGQEVSCAVHEAVSKNTELDLMSWVMRRAPIYRQTCRHASENPTRTPNISHTKDGRWCIAWGVSARDRAALAPFLERYGMADGLTPPEEGADLSARNIPGSGATDPEAERALEAIQRFVRAWSFDNLPWQEAQESGLFWAPLRKPHENALDPHWLKRGAFAEIEHPEIGRSVVYPVSKWVSTVTTWQKGRRAPLLGEDTDTILSVLRPTPARLPAAPRAAEPTLSAHGKPFPLQGVRIFDFSWFLASAGGTRMAAALGAEVIKVEWKAHPDTRLAAMAPVGGRVARENANTPLPGVTDSDMGGQFNNKNPGKRGLSLNIRHPKGLEIAKRMVALSDVVAEGFSPGVLDRAGLGYDVMQGLRPDIIYVQQSGMGAHGTYGRFRTVGPVAAAFAGTSDMSGLPEPAMPAGWGYSYLDWIGAYGFALATLGALYHRERTGEGQRVDSSQCESGIFLGGVPVLDWSVNGRAWKRIGNRSFYKPAAPHGAYRCRGEDAWLAIACFSDPEWRALAEVADRRYWLEDARFATLADRLAHQDALDAAVGAWTAGQDSHEAMMRLQSAGVPAGACQTAADRCDSDPQLAALKWLTEVDGTKIGRWPVAELPVKMSATPPHVGGVTQRGAPCYGEDNEYVLGELLGFGRREIEALAEEEVI
ncbi:CoA transferase [uncultured Jannaschia sp.]|uniref:CaiB/BaiF CoA-transferase family protein n=1 Tax=uncultured Jannaschia sp. TaxID=293347 RepID=UPI00262A309C|nr:CoA transferase [uncultured Jannaschia sp.]